MLVLQTDDLMLLSIVYIIDIIKMNVKSLNMNIQCGILLFLRIWINNVETVKRNLAKHCQKHASHLYKHKTQPRLLLTSNLLKIEAGSKRANHKLDILSFKNHYGQFPSIARYIGSLFWIRKVLFCRTMIESVDTIN